MLTKISVVRCGLEVAARKLQGEVQLSAVSHVHHRAARAAVGLAAPGPRPHQQARHGFHRTLGGREADARGPLLAELVQALQAEGQVGAALVSGQRVNLIHDQRPHPAQHDATLLRGEQQVEGLRGGDQQVGGPPQHGGARRGRCVAGAQRDPQFRHRMAEFSSHLTDLGERLLEIVVDVRGLGLQGRDVDDLGAGGHCGGLAPPALARTR